MMYPQLTFNKPKNRSFFYTSFVSTVDGKIFVKNDGYWPIGTASDYKVFTHLRTFADAIIDGKSTAELFGKRTIDTIHKKEFVNQRKKHGKRNQLRYIIMTKNPSKKILSLNDNPYQFVPTIFTKDIPTLLEFLKKEKVNTVFVGGGPNLFGSLFKKHLIDEIFLTIAPKVFGNAPGKTLTMVEGILLKPHEVKLQLLDVQKMKDELFLRYRVTY